jgi:hypothetical protein
MKRQRNEEEKQKAYEKRAHEASLVAKKQNLPSLPFFFLTYSENENGKVDYQGIMYKVVKKKVGDKDTYLCQGSRKIGTTQDGIKISLIDNYHDEMPKSSMVHIVDKSISPLSKEENELFVDDNKLDEKYKNYFLYFNGSSFWFDKRETENRPNARGTFRTRSNPRNISKNRSNTTRSNRRTPSRNRSNRRSRSRNRK